VNSLADVAFVEPERCEKCDAHSHQPCDRFRLQKPLVCPRQAPGRTNDDADPDRHVGQSICREALQGNFERFPAQAEVELELAELDFHAGEDRA
jgi:hypothetical protein